MENCANLDGELLFAAPALPPLLIGKPKRIADFATVWAEYFAIRPAHRRDFINANLLIAKVLNSFYESGGVCHKQSITNPVRLVKYIITNTG